MSSTEEQIEKKSVYITAGTKGGVGKSSAAVYFSNALTEVGKIPVNIDCDSENATFKRFLEGRAISIDLSQPYAMDEMISIIDSSKLHNFVIDLKAGTGDETLKWLEDVPLEDMKNEGIIVYLIGCITSDPDSTQTFLNWAGRLNNRVEYIVVFNEIDGNDFSFYEQEAEEFEQLANPGKIVIPRLHEIYNTVLNQLGLCLYDYLQGDIEIKDKAFRGRVPHTRLYRYLRNIIEQISEVVANG